MTVAPTKKVVIVGVVIGFLIKAYPTVALRVISGVDHKILFIAEEEDSPRKTAGLETV